jgi:AcrR family transcriptional regulator
VTTVRRRPDDSRRSESSRRAILDAALDISRDEGYARLTVEAIAARAGVGKQTIYRWWPSKAAVLLEAIDEQATADAASFPDSDDLLDDLRTMVTIVARLQARESFRPHLTALIGEAQQDPELRSALLEQFIRPRRAPILARLRRGQDAGQLPKSVDVNTVVEMIFGALYHRLLLRTGPLDDDYAVLVVETILKGSEGTVSPRPTRRNRSAERSAPDSQPSK